MNMNDRSKALLLEVIGEDAVIEGIEFDFESTTFANVFGGRTITSVEACRIAEAKDKYKSCVIVHCTDEAVKKADSNVLAAILAGKGEKLPEINGKALLFRQVTGSVNGFECFTDAEINELIDLADEIVQKFAAEQEQ